MISPSDILHYLLILRMVTLNRYEKADEGEESELAEDRKASRGVLRYLSQALSLGSGRQFNSLSDFTRTLRLYLPSDATLSRTVQHFLSISSHDALDDALQLSPSLFVVDGGACLNGLVGINRLSPDSLLGIFSRTLWATWQALSFEEVCRVSDAYLSFLSPTATTSSSTSRPPPSASAFASASLQTLQLAQEVMKERDVSLSEDLLHLHFDTLPLPPPPLPSSHPSVPSSALPASLSPAALLSSPPLPLSLPVQGELSSLFSSPPSLSKYQDSMLSLSLLHLVNFNPPLCLSALEGALSAAQQRGDHASLSKCLLHLHHLARTPEEARGVLLRALRRAGGQGQQGVVALASLLLAPLLLRRAGGGGGGGGEWSRGRVWELVQLALLGETQLTLHYVEQGRWREGGMEESSPSLLSPLQPPSSRSAPDPPAALDPLYVHCLARASAILSEYWREKGSLFLGGESLSRTLSLISLLPPSLSSLEDLLLLFAQVLDVYLNALLLLSPSPREGLESLERHGEKTLLFFSPLLCPPLLEPLLVVKLKASLLLSLLRGDRAEAKREAEQLGEVGGSRRGKRRGAGGQMGAGGLEGLRCDLIAVIAQEGERGRGRVQSSRGWLQMEGECKEGGCPHLLSEPLPAFLLSFYHNNSNNNGNNSNRKANQ